jgi:hypothetical protein
MWRWRRMEKISRTDSVRNTEVLHRIKGERYIIHTRKRINTNWICHVLRRNCLLKHVTEVKIDGRIEMMGRRGRRRKQLLYDVKERERGQCKLKEEGLCEFALAAALGLS